MQDIHKTIKAQIIVAMKAKDEKRLLVLRSLATMLQNEIISKNLTGDILPDDAAIAVVKRAEKQRKDAIEQFKTGGRPELAKDEEAELAIISDFLPPQMGIDEIKKLAEAKKAELGVTDKAKAPQLIGALMKDLRGKADGNVVKQVIESLFA